MSDDVTNEEEEVVLADLSDEELVEQMHDDMYDGLGDEIEQGTRILLERGWPAGRVLDDALVAGMTIVGIDSATESSSCPRYCWRPTP